MNYPKSTVEKRFYLIFSVILQAVLLNLAWPPHQSSYLAFVGFMPLLFMHRAHWVNPSGMFLLALPAFFLFHLMAGWWMYSSTVAGSLMAHLVNSFCMAAVLFLWSVMDRSFKAGPVLSSVILISFWICFEWLHHHWDIAWPWFTLGNVFSDRTSWIQWYSYSGVLGGSIWVLSVNFILTDALVRWTRQSHNRAITGFIMGLIVLIVPILISNQLWSSTGVAGKSLKVIIVQPDIDPVLEKFDRMAEEQQIAKALNLINNVRPGVADLIVFPETLITQAINEDSLFSAQSMQRILSATVPAPCANIIVGAYTTISASALPDEPAVMMNGEEAYVLYNSAIFAQKDTLSVYHKSELLPLVEKQPFGWLLSPFRTFIEGSGGFFGSYGTHQRALTFNLGDSISLIPAICFESVFGHRVRNRSHENPAILVTLTNDGWWSSSGGYMQHLNYARLRSIENRLWTIRAANTGVSAIIDANGTVVKHTSYGTSEILFAEVPALTQSSFYARYGDIPGIVSAISSFLLLIMYFFNLFRIGKRRTIY
jgi:apolipoprotein N-acyltransferase